MALLCALTFSTGALGHDDSRVTQSATCGTAVPGVAQQFNVLVQHDYGASATDVRGRVAAGGNVSINNYGVGADLSVDLTTPPPFTG